MLHWAAEDQPELLALGFTDAVQMSLTYEAYQRAIAGRPTRSWSIWVLPCMARRRVNTLTGQLPSFKRTSANQSNIECSVSSITGTVRNGCIRASTPCRPSSTSAVTTLASSIAQRADTRGTTTQIE